MKRRSFFKKLFGAVMGGLAAPHLAASAAEPIVVIDPASPWYAARQIAKFKPPAPPVYHYYSLQERRFYRPGDTFEISVPGRRGTGTGPGPLYQVTVRARIIDITE